jgi:hypothetical protein
MVNTANDPDGIALNDWVPIDASSWEALARLRAGTD